MTPNTGRNTTVKLTFDADSSKASRAVEGLRKETERLDRATRDAQLQQQRLMGGGSGRGGMAGGGSPSAGGASDVGFMAKFAVIGFALDRAASIIGKSFDILSNRALSGAQKLGSVLEMAANEIPIAGPIVQAGKSLGKNMFFGDSMRALEESRRNIARNTGLGDLQRQRDMSLDALRLNRVGAMANTDAISSYYKHQNYSSLINDRIGGLAALTGFGLTPLSRGIGGAQQILSPLTSALGNLGNFGMGFRNVVRDPRVLEAEEQSALLRRGLDAPNAELREIQRQGNSLQGGASQLEKQIAQMKKSGPQGLPLDPNNPLFKLLPNVNPNRSPNSFDTERYNGELATLEAQRLKMRESLEKNITMQYEKRKEIIQKEFELSKSIGDVRKAEYSSLADKRSQLTGSLSASGMMSGDQRQNLLYVLQETQRMGFANAPEEYRQLLSSSPQTAEYARQEGLKFAEQDPTSLQIQKLVGTSTVDDLDRQMKKLADTIRQINADAEEQKANDMERAAKDFGSSIAEQIMKWFGISQDSMERAMQLNKTSQDFSAGFG